MIFAREYLNFTKKSFEEKQQVLQILLTAATKGQSLTLSEAKFIGSFLALAESEDDAGRDILRQIYEQLPGYHFWTLYLKYYSDVNGEGTVYDAKGPISNEVKAKDIAFLDEAYQDWSEVISKTNHKHTMLQYLSKESRDDIKAALQYAKQIGDGGRRRDSITKSLVLHSKFVFSKIAEYYEEYDVKKDVLQLCSHEVVIDSFAFAHVAIRHMAPRTKFGRPGKTFFNDRSIIIDELPQIIKAILLEYSRFINCQHFDGRRIYFRLNNVNYVIWFQKFSRNVKGGGVTEFLRVETFYPAELKNDATAITELTLNKVSENLGFYM